MQIIWTELPDKTGNTMTAHTGTYEKLIARVRGVGMFPSKDKCPWIKLASFGTKRSAAGSLRTNDNLTAVYGIEADYDGEQVTMEQAAAMLESYGVRALLYPSPSSTDSGPRWRVLCPLARQPPTQCTRCPCSPFEWRPIRHPSWRIIHLVARVLFRRDTHQRLPGSSYV